MPEKNRPIDEPLQYEPLKEIDIVSHPWLKVCLQYLPWLLSTYALLIYFSIRSSDTLSKVNLDAMHWTGFVAASAVIIMFNVVFEKTSSLLNTLWLTGVFHVSEKSKVEVLSQRIEKMANHPIWQTIIVIAFLGFTAFFTYQNCSSDGANPTGLEMFFCNYYDSSIRTSKAIVEFVTVFFLTLLIWRLVIIAWGIGKLGKILDLTIKWNHPDESGGLSPIGFLCFWIAAIFAAGATYLGGWLIVCPSSDFCGAFSKLPSRLETFGVVLIGVIILSVLSFFWPLWSTHVTMRNEKERLYEEILSPIGQKIDRVSGQLLDNANKLVIQHDYGGDGQELLETSDELEKQLEFLKRIYRIVDKLPEWPFNKQTVLTLLSSQGVPLLGLTGIGSDLLEMIKNFLKP